MRIDVVSIFGEYLAPLQLSLVGKAIRTGLVDLRVHDLRDWTHDRHRTVDDTPYGGGAGMVMKPEPWGEALDDLVGEALDDLVGEALEDLPGEALDDLVPAEALDPASAEPVAAAPRLIVLTPSGRPFTQSIADELAGEDRLILACGRYEGIDARVVAHARTRLRVDEISIGDYVLNGGEAAALVIIEAVVRLLPGVIGNPESLAEESHSVGQDGLLEYPVFTKPPAWRGLEVPAVLFSGHHGEIARWRREQAVALTRERRPELLGDADRSDSSEQHDLVVTEARAADAGEIWTLQRAAFLTEGMVNASYDIPPLTQTLPELAASLSEGLVLVARLQGRLVASVRATLVDQHWYVGRLMVAPDLQGQGLGGRLMTAIEARRPAEATSCRLMTGLASEANIAFYGHRGYAEVERSAGDTGVPVVILERRV